jgi:hypothetical protein
MSTKSLVNSANWRCLVGMEVVFLGYTPNILATPFRKDFVFIKKFNVLNFYWTFSRQAEYYIIISLRWKKGKLVVIVS